MFEKFAVGVGAVLLLYAALSSRIHLVKVETITISERGVLIEPWGRTLNADEIRAAKVKSTQMADVLELRMRNSWFYPHIGGVWAMGKTVRLAFGTNWLSKPSFLDS